MIVGAGAAGLTLAIELARRRVSFRLIEKLDEPFRGARGKGLQPRSLEVFEDLEILDRIAARGGMYPPQRLYRDDGSYADVPLGPASPPTAAEPYRQPLMVPQFATEAVMRERLAEWGGSPEFGHELRAFQQDTEGVNAVVAHAGKEETIRCRYLVGADGGRSFVRHALGVEFPGKTLGVRALVADVHVEGLDRDVWHRFNDARLDTQIAACPLAGTDMFQLQAPVALEGDVDLSAEGLTAIFLARTGRQDVVIRSVSWASVFTMNARLADRYQDGRVLLVGDAAHVHPPTGGQGLNTSVQDAYNLGWKLAAVVDGAPTTLLATYEEERRPIAAQVLGLSSALLEAAKRGSMHRGREVQQLDLGYPESSLALRTDEPHEAIRPGARAPDAPIRSAAGASRRLFDLFRGPHWTLLTYGNERESWIPPRPGLRVHTIAPRGTSAEFVDEGEHVRAAYGLAPGYGVLVRPDGYVGAVLHRRSMATLETYLAQVGCHLPYRPNCVVRSHNCL
ncbi:FAD-dependent oxidoreductase [Pendulispora rubella]|uniref:FAD-dependent oxidoreductase n=1 Tax=Pendulispora rubella TaxID=2741070 RepID=A0ABZ2L615_9BACT